MGYSREELAASYKQSHKGFGNEKLSTDELLLKLTKIPGGDKWLERLDPDPPPLPGFQRMKDAAARGEAALLGVDAKFKQMESEREKGYSALQQPAIPSKTFRKKLSDAAAAAQSNAQLGKMSPRRRAVELSGLENIKADEDARLKTESERGRVANAVGDIGRGMVSGATLGHNNPIRPIKPNAPGATEAGLASGFGQFMGAALPISKMSQAASLGLKAAGITAAAARPALRALAQGATTGLAYGGARKPAEGEGRVQNALNDAAVFMAFTGTGLAFDKAVNWYRINYTAARAGDAYETARQAIIDVFVAKGAQPAKAAEMAEAGLDAAIRAGGGIGRVKAADFQNLAARVKAAAPKPVKTVPLPQIEGPAPVVTPTAAEIPAWEIPAPVVKPPAAIPERQLGLEVLKPGALAKINGRNVWIAVTPSSKVKGAFQGTVFDYINKDTPLADFESNSFDEAIERGKQELSKIEAEFTKREAPAAVKAEPLPNVPGQAVPGRLPGMVVRGEVDKVNLEEPTAEIPMDVVIKLPTDQLEQYVLGRYAAGAPPGELNDLENIFESRISEEDTRLAEERGDMSEAPNEGADLGEDLSNMYEKLLQKRGGYTELPDTIAAMRGVMENFAGKELPNVSNEEVLATAKEYYDARQALIGKYKAGAGKAQPEVPSIKTKTPIKTQAAPNGPYTVRLHGGKKIQANSLKEASEKAVEAIKLEGETKDPGEIHYTSATVLDNKNEPFAYVDEWGIIWGRPGTGDIFYGEPKTIGETHFKKETEVIEKTTTTKLPRELAGAKPRYAFGAKQFDLKFESDVDKAAYITAQTTRSKQDAAYLKFAMEATGLTEAQVRAHGAEVRAEIKKQAKVSKPGTLTVGRVASLPIKMAELKAEIEAEAAPGPAQAPALAPEPAAEGTEIWDMPQDKFEAEAIRLVGKGVDAPFWKPKAEAEADLKKYGGLPNTFRKWVPEEKIYQAALKNGRHNVPPEVIKKYKIDEKEIVRLAKIERKFNRNEQLREYADRHHGLEPFFRLLKAQGGHFNEDKLRYTLGITDPSHTWKGNEFPEELEWYVGKSGGTSVGDFTQAAYFADLIPENDPALAIAGLLQDYRVRKAIKEGGDLTEVLNPKRDMGYYGAGLGARSKPWVDLPGQTFIPGSGPAMPTGKIRKDVFVDQDAFEAAFTAPADTPSLFTALDEAAGAAVPTQEQPKVPGGDASMAAPVLDKVEAVFQPITTDGTFRLWRATELLVEKYARRYGEDKYRPSGVVGVFYRDTKNIFLQAANNVYVAVHEVVHFVDDNEGWFKLMLKTVGTTKNGQPIYDQATKGIRGLLTKFYLETYAGAKSTHPLEKRVKEGLAMVIQKYAESPELFDAPEWKPLVDMILKPGGKYYNKTFADLAADGRAVMDQYRALDANAKFNARKTSPERLRPVSTLFTWKDSLERTLFDDLNMVEVMDVKAGELMTPRSAGNAMRAVKNWAALADQNLKPKRKLRLLLSTGLVTVSEKNPGDLLGDMTLGDASRMDNYLIARRVRAGYAKMEEIRQRILKLTDWVYDLNVPNRKALKDWQTEKHFDLLDAPEEYAAIMAELRTRAADYKRHADLAKEDNIGKDLAEQMYQDGLRDLPKVKEWEKIHDDVCGAIITLFEDVGAISHDAARGYRADKAYASFRRDIMSLAKNKEGEANTVGTGLAASFLKKRHGSELALIGPLKGMIDNLLEAQRKAAIIRAFNTFYRLAAANPELFGDVVQPLRLVVVPDGKGGFLFPQLMDPNIIMCRNNGRYLPLAVLDADLLATIKTALIDPRTAEVVEKVVTTFSRTFMRGTTGWFPPWLIANITQDTATAIAQSSTAYKPFYDHIKIMRAIAARDGSVEAGYAEEYLALTGGRQTLQGMYSSDKTADQAYRQLTGETKAMETALKWVDKVSEIVSVPGSASETFTRITEYINARKAGYDIYSALEMAARITGSFTHSGTMGGRTGRTMVRAGAFINPSLQVFQQYYKTLKDPKKRGRAFFLMAAYTAMILGASYAVKSASKQQKQNYKGRQVGEREGVMFFPLPGEKNRKLGRLGKIRLSDAYAVPANLINMVVQEFLKDDKFTGDEYLQAATAWIPDQLNLLQRTRMLFSWMPVIIGPSIAVNLNKKTYPKPMDLTSKELMDLPRELRFNELTSAPAKIMAGNTENSGWIIKNTLGRIGAALNLNPIEIDYLIEGHLGRMARFGTGRTGTKIFTSPVIAELYLNGTRDLGFFYKVRDAINQQKNAYSQQVKDAAVAQDMALDIDPDAPIKDVVTAAKDAGVKFEGPPEGFEKLMEFQSFTVPTEEMLSRYRFLSRIKNPGPAKTAELEEVRDLILDKINLLSQEYEKKP